MALKKQWFQTNKQTNNGFRTSWSVGEIPGQGAKIPYFLQPRKKKKKTEYKIEQYYNKINKDFKNGQHQKNL